MNRARRLFGCTLLLACTPHEHPREPHAPCAPGMALVEGGPGPSRLCVDITEVTTAAYGACVHAGACAPAVLAGREDCNLLHADRGAHPINCVTLEQAWDHCAWLGKRLPTDDERPWAVPKDSHDIAPDASLATGFRCVVAPHTPVDAADLDVWTPHRPGAAGLPVLAAPVPREAPTRPLANLGLLHHGPHRGAPGRWWPLGDGFLPADPADADPPGFTDPIDHATLPEGLREFTPLRDLGDTLLMTAGWSNNLRYVAVEPATFKIRWQLALAKIGASYQQFIAPRTLVVAVYGDGADLLLGFSLASGREVWRLHGGPQARFTRIKRLWTDGARGYIHTDRGLVAFDPVDGAQLWSYPVGEHCGVVTGDGALVVEAPIGHGFRRLAPATGAEIRRIAHGGTVCVWGKSPYDGGVAPAVLESGLLITFVPPDDHGASALYAHDLDTGFYRWHRDGLARDLLVADHDAVYVTRTGEELIALDIATGEPRVEISLGTTYDLEVGTGGGPRGPLLVATTHGGGTWILGRAEQPALPEPYRIRGRLVPDGVARRQVAGVRVRVGERRVRTDAAGRFEVRGRAVGVVAVALGTDRGPGEPGGSRVRFEPVTVTLDGRGTYDVGDQMLYPWYVE